MLFHARRGLGGLHWIVEQPADLCRRDRERGRGPWVSRQRFLNPCFIFIVFMYLYLKYDVLG